MESSKLIKIACIVGFVGDSLLQISGIDYGLKDYFAQHGKIESTFIAGGMTTLFYTIYLSSGLPINYFNLAIYGIILDLLFRKFMIFPSLAGYYSNLNYFWSGFWEVFSMVLPLFILNLLKN